MQPHISVAKFDSLTTRLASYNLQQASSITSCHRASVIRTPTALNTGRSTPHFICANPYPIRPSTDNQGCPCHAGKHARRDQRHPFSSLISSHLNRITARPAVPRRDVWTKAFPTARNPVLVASLAPGLSSLVFPLELKS
jgi:hypothetical protein